MVTFDEKNQDYLGFKVQTGVNGNFVFVWDEVKDAAAYIIELYRAEFKIEGGGFLKKAEIVKETRNNYGSEYQVEVIKNLQEGGPFYNKKEFINYVPYAGGGGRIDRFSFIDVKPLCTLSVDHNTYYKAINDLPFNSFVAIFKVEDRQGNIIKEAVPYCFNVGR